MCYRCDRLLYHYDRLVFGICSRGCSGFKCFLRPGHFARECPEGDGKGKSGICVNLIIACPCAQAADLAEAVTLAAVAALGQEGTEMEVTF